MLGTVKISLLVVIGIIFLGEVRVLVVRGLGVLGGGEGAGF